LQIFILNSPFFVIGLGLCKIEVRHTFGKKKSLLLFFLSKNALRKVLLNIMLSNVTQLFLENRERRFSKIIYA